jgi:hypothetical protein
MNITETPGRRRRMLLALVYALAIVLPLAGAGTATAQDGDDDVIFAERVDGRARNMVMAHNHKDERMMVRGSVELDRVPGLSASPFNMAQAVSSCVDCKTFAVALQIALVNEDANVSTPQNYAVAFNIACTRCVTVARAVQYVVPVADPKDEPETVRRLVKEMDRELRDIAQLARRDSITVEQADARINTLIAEFRALGLSLYEQRQVAVE